jgi:50S ribosomal subunit-associated GTPase HflX
MVEVWNKVDLVEDKSALEQPGQAILLSALKGTGMKKLM